MAHDWQPANLPALNRRFEAAHPRDILRWGLTTYGDDIALATGFGISGIALMHMVAEIRPKTTVFYLETDLLFAETYALRDRLQQRLGVEIKPVHSGLTLGTQRHEFGQQLWRRAPDLCCQLRKVNPLQRFLADKKAWITGIRRDQSKSRAHTSIVSWDQLNRVSKLCPLASWQRKEVWRYLAAHKLPYNPLLDQGYSSIGCHTCTRAANAEGNLRAGRWAGTDKIECGIHLQPHEDASTAAA